MHNGACLCGAVRFAVDGPLHAPDACHCSQCRRQTGHFWASTDVARSALTLHGEEHVKWFSSSPRVERGFCSVCGSTLFWRPVAGSKIAISMGAFDKPTETQLSRHIYVADKGDYYEIGDGLPQNLQ